MQVTTFDLPLEDTTKTGEREAYLDVLRLLACFFVIVNHTIIPIYENISPSVTWFVSLGAFLLCKSAVPLFLMITGALWLTRNRRDISYYIKRAVVIAIEITATTFLYRYLLGNPREVVSASSIGSFVKGLAEPYPSHLWYLYMYIGILLMLPILKFISTEYKLLQYSVILAIILPSVLPILEHYGFVLMPHITMPFLHIYPATVLLGYWLSKVNFKQNVVFYVLLIAVVILLQLGMLYQSHKTNTGNWMFLDSRGRLITMISVAVCLFIVARKFLNELPHRISHILAILSRGSFIAYLVHMYFIEALKPLVYTPLYGKVHTLIVVLIWQLCVFVVSLAVGCLMKRILFVDKYL